MYLKSLTLKGFKSFADRAHLVFEPGLTVIVGPNGSGKSNVSDAILWVLGEQSAKQLRGQAMEDVVFAGSSARKAAGVAEVDLTLDNSDHTLPVDFDEVVVTRRMYRSGESEYLVNGAPARLMDITDILHDSGLGKDTHSIIGQGKLDAILMSRPEERRALVEEAAGISKHKRRRERAERKLVSMDAHLRRALDVQKEVNRQLRPLERQVAKAQRHNEVSARAAELRTVLAVDNLRRLKEKWGRLERIEADAAAELAAAQEALAAAQRRAEELQALADEQARSTGGIAGRRQRAERAVERLAGAVRLLDEKGRNMDARRAEAQGAFERAERRAGELAGEIQSARAERDANRARQRDLRAGMEDANARVRGARERRREAEDALQGMQRRQRSLQHDRDAAAVALAKARDAQESARVQDELLAGRIAQLEQGAAEDVRAAEDFERRRAEFDARLAEARRRRDAAARAAAEAREALGAAQRAEADARRAAASAEAQVVGLERAAQAQENAAPLAGRLAQAAPEGAVAARVGEVLDVPAELAPLVEALLGPSLAGFVAPDAATACELARRAGELASSSKGCVEVLDAQACAPEADVRPDGAPGWALLDRVGVRPGFEGAARALLGGVYVVEGGIAEACAASARDLRGTYVTRQGWKAFAGGRAVVGGEADATAGLIECRRKLRELTAALPGLRGQEEAARAAVARAEREGAAARAASDEASQAVARLTGEASSLAGELDRRRRARDAAVAELGRVRAQREQVRARAEEARAACAAQAVALESAEGGLAGIEDDLVAAQDAFDAARREDRAAHDEANACQLELARVQERSGSLDARVERLEREGRDVAAARADSKRAAGLLAVTCARVAPLRARMSALLEAAQERASALRGLAEAADADAASLRAQTEQARTAVADANLAHSRALAGAGDVKVERGRLDVQVDAAVKAIQAQKGVVLEEALGLPAPQDRAADERELARLEEELAQMGPVNQVAFEEYEGLRRRADYIAEQVEDLQHARGDLTKILSAIDRKMRRSFLDTFEAVNENFVEIFAMLFPGGSGHLELTDPDRPDETGIEVVAQPRGKRVTKMTLLSGGERSLTALGLLFAVYRTRTVPFYVLDEVEAALDDSNLDRLLGAIEVLRETTQLIVISHQRRTMEAADVLYGVSMQADGVSRVVSQKLDHAADRVA